MIRRLPSLETLRFLEAAGRCSNFTQAAAELNVTPGAVSQRIKSLEEILGVRLFDRNSHEMALTEKGRILFDKVTVAMKEIAFGIELISPSEQSNLLSISLLPAFASRWLLPRLADFNARCPDLRIRIKAEPPLAAFGDDGVDLAIRFGVGTWSGLHAEKLFEETLFPVASPLFNAGKLPKDPRDLLGALLLQDERVPWSIWFKVAGLPTDHPVKGTSFSDANLLLQAAVAGRGIALARGALVAEDLAYGRLVQLFDIRAASSFGYFLVHPLSPDRPKEVKRFRDWLLEEASKFDSDRRSIV
jgi:LysR family transcriptional regulator, glycine cleavage system transcriptional activator